MDPHATYDDVNLVLRLYELRREEKLRAAREWFARSFKATTIEELQAACPLGSQENAFYRMVVSYWEMAASFITSGVLNQDLFFQSGGEMLLVFERLRQLLPLIREQHKNPNVYKNLETVAQAYIRHMNRNAPGAYEAMAARLRGM